MIGAAIPRAITTHTMTCITWQILRVGAEMLRIILLEPHDNAHGRSVLKKKLLWTPSSLSFNHWNCMFLYYDYAYNLMQMCLSIFCLQMKWKWWLNHTKGPVLRHMQLGLWNRKIAWLQNRNSQQFRAILGLRPWHPQQPCAWSGPPHGRSSPTRCHTSTQPSRR